MVKLCEKRRPGKEMKGVLDSWNSISVIDGGMIKLAEIYTQPYSSVFLAHNDHIQRERGL